MIQLADNRWFVVEKTGLLKTFSPGDPATTTFLDISALVSGGGEQGFLGLAFHPNFPTTPYFYISYTDVNGTSVIARYTTDAGGTAVVDGSRTVILTQAQPYANHNGGHILFGPDGYLYIGLGDGGYAGDPQNNAQNTETRLGAMLRIDVDGGTPYAIPADNPFAGSTCPGGDCPEIYAWGLRNPWRFAFDGTDLWVGDVGQGLWEEVDLLQMGRNYGWRCYEGNHAYNLTGCTGTDYLFPAVEYHHDDGNCSVSGGMVYRGTNPDLAWLAGSYLFADYCSGRIWRLTGGPGAYGKEELFNAAHNISAFAVDNTGEVYALDVVGNGVYRLDDAPPPSTPDPGQVQALLSQTPFVQPGDVTQPADCLIPFEVIAPLWSDGAAKRRWMALPDNTYIVRQADGDWQFPVGTVLMKEFSLAGKRVETRLFMRHLDGTWAGYTYEWNALETEAALLDSAKKVTVGSQDWLFPSREQCLTCHTSAACFALGPETAQLNSSMLYPSTGRTANQLLTLDHIGMFSLPLGDPSTLPALADPYGTAPAMERSRAYLHSNCAGCHRPNGPTRSAMNLMYQESLGRTGICNTPPELGDLGIVQPRLLAPGLPDKSVIPARMNRTDAFRMPPLASFVVDAPAVNTLRAWITGQTACGLGNPWDVLLR